MQKKTKIKIAGLILIILGIVGGFFFFMHKKVPDPWITLYGNVDIRQVNTAFRVDGRLAEMRLEEGDSVKKDEVIALLDAEPILNRLNQSKAQVEQAKATLDNAIIVNNRKQSLCDSKTIATQECDDSKMYLQTSKANLHYAESVLAEAETAYKDAVLKAPSNGIILTRIVEPGTMIKAGVPVYTISLNNKMWIRAYIKESELGKIKIGSPVEIMTDSSEKIYKGQVGFISSQAEFTPKNIETASLRTDLVYRLRITVDEPDDALKQGMPVTIRIKTP